VGKGNEKSPSIFDEMICQYFRVWRHFEAWMKKGGLISGTGSDYLLPSECCVMVNVILDCKAQVNIQEIHLMFLDDVLLLFLGFEIMWIE
jgi:hypothetical protein